MTEITDSKLILPFCGLTDRELDLLNQLRGPNALLYIEMQFEGGPTPRQQQVLREFHTVYAERWERERSTG